MLPLTRKSPSASAPCRNRDGAAERKSLRSVPTTLAERDGRLVQLEGADVRVGARRLPAAPRRAGARRRVGRIRPAERRVVGCVAQRDGPGRPAIAGEPAREQQDLAGTFSRSPGAFRDVAAEDVVPVAGSDAARHVGVGAAGGGVARDDAVGQRRGAGDPAAQGIRPRRAVAADRCVVERQRRVAVGTDAATTFESPVVRPPVTVKCRSATSVSRPCTRSTRLAWFASMVTPAPPSMVMSELTVSWLPPRTMVCPCTSGANSIRSAVRPRHPPAPAPRAGSARRRRPRRRSWS